MATGAPADSGTQQLRSARHAFGADSASREARTVSSWAENFCSSATRSAISACFSSTSRTTRSVWAFAVGSLLGIENADDRPAVVLDVD